MPEPTPWGAAYRADRDAVLLARIRIASLLILAVTVVIALASVVAEPGTASVRLPLVLPVLAVAVGGIAASRARACARRAVSIALAFVLLLISTAAINWQALPQDASLVPLYVCVLTLMSTLVFPWGPWPQGIACLYGLGCYVWAIGGIATRLQVCATVILVGIVPLSVIGAAVFEGSRRAIFERAWQEEQLLSLARELARQTDPAEAIRVVLDHAVGMLGVGWAFVALRDPARRTVRVSAIRGERADPAWVGIDVPEEFGAARLVFERGLVAFPADAPESPLVTMLREYGIRHALYVCLRYGGEALGILGAGRAADVPFGEAERRLAQGLAGQASLALRTTRLITDLQRASQLKSEFVSTVSHELRTPLNVILGYADMARDALANPVLSVADCVDRIEAAGRDLLALVESTLEIGKLEAHRDEVRLEPVALPAFWRELGAGCARLPRAAAVALEWIEPVADVVVRTDPRKLSVLLRNLVGNACKFTARGHVRARCRIAAGRLVVDVEDTGIGIRPEDREAIFEMFRQADGSDSRRYGGAGLGLYIVRRFAEQLGGTVTLESTPGVGSTFTVSLPGPEASAAADAA
ncbi:MAG TPA: HAMP domain-containing sensor histidine kinase [Candidatus Binatia bacterium]|nr:HAMP domain-containing sensor histidine kinase [Candidatus Binatia bacterium]